VELATARSFLFAPGNEERKLRKALAAGADAVIADLEDGVAPEMRAEAREVVGRVLRGVDTTAARLVRVNPPGSEWFADDVELAADLPLEGVVLPKATPEAVEALGPDGPPVVAIVESAGGLAQVAETARARRVTVLALGSHDLSAELRLAQRADQLELLFPRAQLVLASANAGIRAPVDTVFLDVRDQSGLEHECRLAWTLGLRGKLCIHPDQLPAVHRVFAPSEEELDWARRVLEAHDLGLREGRGAVALDGRMIDMPIVKQARRLLAEGGRDG
jgi:citrate lyase subunit beta/citryl-CoA lyase